MVSMRTMQLRRWARRALLGAGLLLAPIAGASVPLMLDGGGGLYTPPSDHITPESRAQMLAEIDQNIASAALALGRGVKQLPPERLNTLSTGGATLLQWPVRPALDSRRDRQSGVSNFVDLDGNFPDALRDYHCGTRTYDTSSGYNHQGIDISSWPYPWLTMDSNGLDIVAAAPGTIVLKRDNEPDRSCALNPNADWNVVIVQHDDGTRAMYGHMKIGSLTSKAVGDTVAAGEYLGQVGSSGNSTGPHLHFELLDEQNNHIDPFVGECSTGGDSRWIAQPAYNVPRVHAVLTGSGAPQLGQCDGSEVSHETNRFDAGDPIYVTAFFTNQQQGMSGTLEIIDPSGAMWMSTEMGPASQDYPFSYFWRAFAAPATAGRWRAQVRLGDDLSETEFFIGQDEPPRGAVVASLLPSSRSVQVGGTASFFATMANAGSEVLTGCRILAQSPVNADFSFQTTDPATNAVVGAPNATVDIPVGAAQSFVVALTPNAASQPLDVEFAFRCNNADRAATIRGLNTLQFSASTSATADILPVAATTSGDGVARLGGPSGSAAFATAAVNIGAAATGVVLVPELAGGGVDLSLCETDAQGQCLAAPAPTLSVDFDATPRTFTVFVSGRGQELSLDPANRRVALRFEQNGVVRGATSVAVTTDR